MTHERTNHDLARQTVAIRRIQQEVAIAFGFTADGLIAPGRTEPRVSIRQIAELLARQITRASYPDLAAAFGKKDHNTMINAFHAANKKIAQDRHLKVAVDSLRRRLQLIYPRSSFQ